MKAFRLGVLGDAFRGRISTRGFSENLADMDHHLDVFYISSKLGLACEIQNRRQLHNAAYQTGLIEEVVSWLDGPGKPLQEVPAVGVYYQIYLMFAHEEAESHYQELVVLLKNHSSLFPKQEAYRMYAYALNFCTRQINRGNRSYMGELFVLYQQLLNTGLLLEEGILAHSHYKNITTVGLRLKKFDWVRNFLDTYQSSLHPAYQENAYSYNLSIYYYEQEKYHEAMRLLQQVEFTDVFYQLSARCMLMKIYYELGDWDGLKYLSQAFLAFLKRNKHIPSYHIQTHQNFIRFTKKSARLAQALNRLTIEEYQDRKQQILSHMQQAGVVSHSRWIEQKLDALSEVLV